MTGWHDIDCREIGTIAQRDVLMPINKKYPLEKLLAAWQTQWPFAGVRLLDQRWVEPDMEDVFQAYSRGYNQQGRHQAEPAQVAYAS